jgi:23S rRNA pseudouridine1911/1915/1917 synthase
MVHADGRSAEPTVVDWFLSRVPTARGVGEPGRAQDGTPLERSGVVHRLDRDTSGLLVLTKTEAAFQHVKAQFHDRLVKKEYRAFVYGTMKEKWGTIDRAIGRNGKDFRLRSAERGARGVLRPAVTDWELIGQSTTHAYLKIFPKTGRTHQIRVHLKSIGRPIVHDPLYAKEPDRRGGDLEFTRLALHSYALTLVLPSGEERMFLAPMPLDFEIASTAIATA